MGFPNLNRPRTTALRAAISFAAIAIVAFFAIQFSRREIEKSFIAHYSQDQGVISNLIAIRIEDFVADIRNELTSFGEREGIHNIKRDLIRNDMIELLKALEPKATTVTRMDSLGVIRFTWPDTTAIGQSVAYQSHVRRTIAEHCAVISQPILTVQGYRAVAIHEPVFDNGTKWLGNICALVPFEAIENKLLSELRKIGSEGFIIDSTGEILYHPDLATGTLLERALPRDSSEVIAELLKALPGEFSGWGSFVDHTGKKRPIGIATIELGDYHWYLATYKTNDDFDGLLTGIRRRSMIAFVLIFITLFCAYLFYGHFGVGRLIREWRKISDSSSRGQERIIELLSSGLRALGSKDSEREILQVLVENLREVGGFYFAGLFKRRGATEFSLASQVYSNEKDFGRFLDEADTDPFAVKVFADPLNPIVRSLLSGEAVKLVSNEQAGTLSSKLTEMGKALDKVLPRNEKYILPVRVNNELLGSLILCAEFNSIMSLEAVEPFVDQIARALFESEASKSLRECKELFWDVSQNAKLGILIFDSELILLSFNKMLEAQFGFRSEFIGRSATEVFKSTSALGNEAMLREVIESGIEVEIEEATYKHNTAGYFRKRLVPIFSSAGTIRHIVVFIEDITPLKQIEEQFSEAKRQIEKTATTDELTGLCNHHFFMERLHLTMEAAREAEAPLSLIIMDIKDLKGLNDRWGRRIGDEVLKNVARIISERISTSDIAARFGGDEFAILLRNTPFEGALARAELIRANIEDKAIDKNAPIDASATATFGITELADDIQSTDEFFRRAERALYKAKSNNI